MKFSDEQMQGILELKERLAKQIERHREEIEILEKNIKTLDSILKQSSFTKASDLAADKPETQTKEPESEKIPITKGSGGEVIANAYVMPDKVSIVLDEKIDISPETPPFKSFFLERILGEMKRKDSAEIQNGKIPQESAIEYTVNKNGSNLREIVIRNYRQKDRVNEIINTAAWSLSRMIENASKSV